MAERDTSLSALVQELVDDARELIRVQMALARVEIRQEMLEARTAGIAFGAAAVAAVLGVTLLCIALGGGIAALFNWPAWAGYGVVALLLLGSALALLQYGRGRFARVGALPKTTQTVRENLAWMQNKGGRRLTA